MITIPTHRPSLGRHGLVVERPPGADGSRARLRPAACPRPMSPLVVRARLRTASAPMVDRSEASRWHEANPAGRRSTSSGSRRQACVRPRCSAPTSTGGDESASDPAPRRGSPQASVSVSEPRAGSHRLQGRRCRRRERKRAASGGSVSCWRKPALGNFLRWRLDTSLALDRTSEAPAR